MPVQDYGVLKGTVRDAYAERGRGRTPHYQILVVTGEERYRVPVNVLSGDGSEVMFLVDDDFHHPITSHLDALKPGFHPGTGDGADVALDYVRDHLFDRDALRQLPASAPGDLNDLQDFLALYVERARDEKKVSAYAFGSRWMGGRPLPPDERFGTDRGVHDIHMNQGNPQGNHDKDNGAAQDGGLLLHFEDTDRWVAFFLKFKTQSWFTDNQGNATESTPDHLDVENPLIQIVGAMVRPQPGAPETVLLLNTGSAKLSLKGWSIVDKEDNAEALSALALAPGEVSTVELSGKGAKLADTGGVILLRDAAGNQVDGVTYTKKQARRAGRLVTFR